MRLLELSAWAVATEGDGDRTRMSLPSGPHVKSSYGHTVAMFRNATGTSQGLFRV